MPDPEEINKQIPVEVPVFLRKTYVMICCSPDDIAQWINDGESFVIKNPERFEREVIPKFFKHNKFTSFVRQLNFYAFRKIKYAESICIDAKTEEETANYWRFRHDKFIQGKPKLLTDIKRTNGVKAPANAATKSKLNTTTNTSNSNSNSTTTNNNCNNSSIPGDTPVQAEVQDLKKQIEEMTRNIDHLTAMVEKVSLQRDNMDQEVQHLSYVEPGSKRKKMDEEAELTLLRDIDSMVLDPSVDPVVSMPPIPPPPTYRERQGTDSTMASSKFMDQLFDVFDDDGDDYLHVGAIADEEDNGRPDPLLMKRLSDALVLLPRNIQEMIVDKLVAAITSTEFVTSVVTPQKLSTIPQTEEEFIDQHNGEESAVQARENDSDLESEEEPMPLAAETLLALIQHYENQRAGKKHKNAHKSIPVIPVHA